MAGLYVHIPFCRQQCNYCDFHFTVSFKQKERVLAALKQEIKQRADEGENIIYQSVYIGGGTPSILTPDELEDLFSLLYKHYKIQSRAEITIETNPDDLKPNFLKLLKNSTPVNRLSIGIQSFHDRDLQLMNRLHTATGALKSIEDSKAAGYSNINLDLIYGIPNALNKDWRNNLKVLEKLEIPHLSAYHLTIEPKTVFAYYRKKGMIKEMPEEESLRQFETLMEFAGQAGYEHYEISNFAKSEFYSRHNLGYWTQKPYLGFGPSAHSFNGIKRRWNVANNALYVQAIEKGIPDYYSWEEIDTSKAYNEYVLTSLRTIWGIDLDYLEKWFGADLLKLCLLEADKFMKSGKLILVDRKLCLSNKGKLIADYVISELMKV